MEEHQEDAPAEVSEGMSGARGEQVERVEHVPGQQASTAVSQTPGSRQDSKTVKLVTFLERIKSSFYLARVKIGPARARLGTWIGHLEIGLWSSLA